MDLFLKIILTTLLFFTTFAFAGTEPWAFSIMQGGIVAGMLLLLFSRKYLILPPPLKPVLFTLGFLILLGLLQCIFPQTLLDKPAWHPVTLMQLYTLDHVSLFVTYAALVFWVPQLLQSSRSLRLFAMLIALCGLAVALCALCFPNGEYIHLLAGRRGGVGPFFNRNHAGAFMGMSALVTLGYVCVSFLDYAHFAAHNRKNQFYLRQGFFILVFIGLCIGVVYSRSRGGMLALASGLFCYSFLCTAFVPHSVKTRIKGVTLVALILLLFSGWVITHVEQINAFAHRLGGTSEETRQMLYRAALDMLHQRPIWGIGIGALPVAVSPYMEWQLSQYVERLHSDWLEIILGTGYIGFVPILAGVAWFTWLAFKRISHLESRKKYLFASLLSALLVMAVGSIVDFDFFIPAVALLFFLLLGMVCSPSYHKGHVHSMVSSWPLRFVVLLVCLAACWLPGQKTAAWRLHQFGRGFKAESQLAAYEQALQHYPSPRYALYLGTAYLNQSFYAADKEQRKALRAQAHKVAQQYLQKYPKEKELSRLYMRSFPLE